MLPCKAFRLLCGLGALSGVAHAQCYDLTSIYLYELTGRFQERWNKPIWHAKAGEGNFHVDESPWLGGLAEFVIFTIGQVQKTGSGWVPLRRSRVPEQWCDETPERSDIFCFTLPYQTPSPQAHRVTPLADDRETWSLTRDGLLRYTHPTSGQSPFSHAYDFGTAFEAILDLNTGMYSAVGHTHSKGHYTRRIPEGVELWRDTTLSARAKLIPQPCSASVRPAALRSGIELQEEEAHPLPICVARLKTDGGKSTFEFVVNPKNAVSPEGCVIAHEGPMPDQGSKLAQTPKKR
jgi:hypothetical protein